MLSWNTSGQQKFALKLKVGRSRKMFAVGKQSLKSGTKSLFYMEYEVDGEP